ncbi:amino acid ABC transporter membrane protein (PAAT family)|uniref:Putative glutamine transport system permease protein GlnP n=1 Tax=Brenneria salicis ATCC 15712 = DSM 30166 TaxID=714314 RepID=A0A366I8K4_9GAMM|nr:amino acid ABC transporter permease [Brenneria salicis]NMN91722.1 amino acid ABC transporter membrane protein (PAAT family) [Brenneria salicis ATCC 15712 = DSM 30166]RBP65780.1 amino acid ABC transporter membrane protein (PAAT family) [Brenneria salicis ATCC 15712 = DSM 30166]RLM31820.1 ABC transporter permease [Brenneria salicis ATCC 15712 = DSM 30166]
MSLDLNFSPVFASSDALLAGTLVTIEITLCALILGCVLGLMIGVARINPQRKAAYGIASAYVAVIRGTPLLVQLFIWYYGLPRLGIMLPSFFCGVIGLGLYSAAYISEIVRGAITSIDRGQNEAARSLGMSSKQAMMKIILPQAVVRMLPPLGNEFIALIKNSALVSLITIHDVMQQGNTIISNTYRDLETYLVIAIIYFVLTSLTVMALRHFEKRHHQRGVQ